MPSAERERLATCTDDLADWRVWGPYLSGRQWATVREDYSPDGDAWGFFPFEHAHRRAYRWGEDGISGLGDRYGFLNIAIALWNGADDRLKERWFGLTGPQGNHGEDVKEHWWHLDATPTHSFAQALYRYPQAAFPYTDLVATNAARGRDEDEYELADTGVLAQDRFFDVVTTHAKAGPFDVVLTYAATNHGPEPAPLDLVPQVWFRNTWSWGRDERRPSIVPGPADASGMSLLTQHAWLGRYRVVAEGSPEILFCDNETNVVRCFGTDTPEQPDHPKDAIDDAIVHDDRRHLSPYGGTKAAFRYRVAAVAPGETVTVRLRLVREDALGGRHRPAELLSGLDDVVAARRAEAAAFYAEVIPLATPEEDRFIARRGFAGLMWGKQVYRYDVRQWLEGDPAGPPPPESRRQPQPLGRNTFWPALSLADVISMPDEWEYPWFATWDLAFHCVALAHVDPAFAKEQLTLMCREWVMHSSGQQAAYEWNLSDVNPPVHAWAAWQVFSIDGGTDHAFLVRIFGKLLLNFGWWVNRKDVDGSNLFEGGFLGMDNIGAFDRSQPLAGGQRLEQADATSWMAFFCLNMLRIAWELARQDKAWEDMCTKFYEHFLDIAEAMDRIGTGRIGLWNDEDGFFYDTVVDDHDGSTTALPIRSMVGLLPLMAVATEPDWVETDLPDYMRRSDWLLGRRPELRDSVVHSEFNGIPDVTLSLMTPEQLSRVLLRLLDEGEFLSPYGLRSLSAAYRGGFDVVVDGQRLPIQYTPAESRMAMFGGNSNWRGPVWFPVNLLICDALRTYAVDMSREVTLQMPTGSGEHLPLREVVAGLEQRLVDLFRVKPDGRRPSDPDHLPTGPLWGQAHPTFSEYFNGDTGAGLGASHQSGWTACVAHLICMAHRDIHVERDRDH